MSLLNKTFVIIIIILLFGAAILPSINISAYQNSNKNLITVDFIGLDYNKSYSANLSFSHFTEIRNMLDEKEKTLSNQQLDALKYIYCKLETFDLLEKNDTTLLLDLYQKNNKF